MTKHYMQKMRMKNLRTERIELKSVTTEDCIWVDHDGDYDAQRNSNEIRGGLS